MELPQRHKRPVSVPETDECVQPLRGMVDGAAVEGGALLIMCGERDTKMVPEDMPGM